MLEIGSHPPNRRDKMRFPLQGDVRFRVRDPRNPLQGTGEVVEISSRSLAFQTETPPHPGALLTFSVSWPAVLNHSCHLRLAMEGAVLRTEGNLVVASIQNYEFRTSGKIAESTAAGAAPYTQTPPIGR